MIEQLSNKSKALHIYFKQDKIWKGGSAYGKCKKIRGKY